MALSLQLNSFATMKAPLTPSRVINMREDSRYRGPFLFRNRFRFSGGSATGSISGAAGLLRRLNKSTAAFSSRLRRQIFWCICFAIISCMLVICIALSGISIFANKYGIFRFCLKFGNLGFRPFLKFQHLAICFACASISIDQILSWKPSRPSFPLQRRRFQRCNALLQQTQHVFNFDFPSAKFFTQFLVSAFGFCILYSPRKTICSAPYCLGGKHCPIWRGMAQYIARTASAQARHCLVSSGSQ